MEILFFQEITYYRLIRTFYMLVLSVSIFCILCTSSVINRSFVLIGKLFYVTNKIIRRKRISSLRLKKYIHV